MKETVKLDDLIAKIKRNDLILPDFQRKFVWTSDEMKNLFASIICRLPIGSYLTLTSTKNDFKCKKIGSKSRKDSLPSFADGVTKTYLIDGQQRLTSLLAGFTTYYFDSFGYDSDKIASDDLLNMYMLKIPMPQNKTDEDDIFRVHNLEFNPKEKQSKYFRTSNVRKLIDVISVEKIPHGNLEINFKDKDFIQYVTNYCMEGHNEYYYIPLQFIWESDVHIKTAYKTIREMIFSAYKNQPENKDKVTNWSDDIKEYLDGCLSLLELYEINVDNSDRERAIDIYSNLNIEGVRLDPLDLLMARVATVSNENFYDQLLDYVGSKVVFPEELISDPLKSWIKLDGVDYQNVCDNFRIIKNEDTIDSTYINVLLNVLALKSTEKQIEEKHITLDENTYLNAVTDEKKNNLEPRFVYDNAKIVCCSINIALLFFQTRCGIKKISEINYKAHISTIAFLISHYLIEDENSNSFIFDMSKYDLKFINTVFDLFEYWYWISLFGNLYPTNQDKSIYSEIYNLKNFLDDVRNVKINFYTRLHNVDKNKVLTAEDFSDQITLTMQEIAKTGREPSAKLTNYICQFYLSKTYPDLLPMKQGQKIGEVTLNAFYPNSFETHHIMPLATDIPFGDKTSERRKNKKDPYNSPLNMVYISKDANRLIGPMKYDEYSKDPCLREYLPKIGCVIESLSKYDLKDFLNHRYTELKKEISEKLNLLESHIELLIKERGK